MAETMYAAPGVGLAATQVDVHKRIIVIDFSDTKDDLLVLVNPEIVMAEGEAECEEGCLSVPGYYDKVTRAARITVRAQERARRTDRADRGRPPRRVHPARNGPPARQDVRRLPVAAEARAARRQAEQEAAPGGLTRALRRPAVERQRLSRSALPARPPLPRTPWRAILDAGFAVPVVLTQPDRPQRARAATSALAGQGARAASADRRCCSRRRCAREDARARAAGGRPRRAGGGRVWAHPAARRPRRGPATAASTSTRRCCRAGAAPRRSSTRSWRAMRATGITIMQMDAGLDTGPDGRRGRDCHRAARDRRHRSPTKLAAEGAAAIVRALQRARSEGALAADAATRRGRDVRGQDRTVRCRARLARSPRMRSTAGSAPSIPAPGASRVSARDAVKVWAAEPRGSGARARPGTIVAVGSEGDRRRVRRRRVARCAPSAGGRQAHAARPPLPPGAACARRRAARLDVACTTSSAPPRSRVRRVLDGATLPAALAAVAGRRAHARPRARAGARLRHAAALGTACRARPQALAAKPLRIRCSPRSSRWRCTSSITRKAPPFAIVDRAVDAAALVARAQAKPLVNAMLRRYLRERDSLERAGRAGEPGRALVVPALVDRPVSRRIIPRIGETILAAGNERPPLTLARQPARDDTRKRSARASGPSGIADRAGRRVGLIVCRAAAGARAARATTKARSRCRMRARSSPPRLLDRARRHARARRLRGAGRQDHAPRRARRRSTSRRSTATPRGCARGGEPRAPAPRRPVHPRRGGRRRRSRRAGGTAGPTTASWPTCRAPPRASCAAIPTASGCGARATSPRSARSSGGSSRGLWPLLAPGGRTAVRDLLRVRRRKTSCKSAISCRAPARRCAKPSAFRANIPHAGGQLLPSGNGAGHNQDGFFYALLRKADRL